MTQEAGKRLIFAIRKQNEKTGYFCTAENISPNVAVHEIRKSFKRIRALLHFYDELNEPLLPKFKQNIKQFGRELSTLRESFVNVQLFEREVTGNQLIAELKLKTARDELMNKNRQLLEERYMGNGLCESIRQMVDDFNAYLDNEPIVPPKYNLFRQVIATYNLGYKIYRSMPAEQPPVEMHELRKKMKRLWYQLDFLRFMQPRFFRLKTDQLNHIAEHLGEDHDLHVFLEELKSVYLGFDKGEKQILENQVLHLRELNLLKLNPRLNQFFSESPEDFEVRMQKIFKLE